MIKLTVDLSNINALVAKLESLNIGSQDSSLVRVAALSVLGNMRRRIQINGKDANGLTIGQYSTKPAYFSLAISNKSIGRPLGKEFNGKRRSVFKSGERKGKDHTTRYFANGYYGWKTAMKANKLGTVNLTLSGTFFNQMTILPTSKGWGIGWADTLLTDRAKYFQGTDKYNRPIFNASASELATASTEVKDRINNAFSR
jgi:hypothetical protein